MPETLTEVRAGLHAGRAAVPLTGVKVAAEVSAFCARVVVTQRYVNTESQPIEATYLFPLDESAAVCGFEALIDGTLVVGEVHDREEAFKRYDEAIARGDGAYLLDEERPDVFQANVGNLPAGKEVVLRLTYVTELAVDGTGLRLTIPTTVAPRYAPAEDRGGVGRSDAEALSAPLDWSVPYGLELDVRLAMNGPITRVESPSHPISVTTTGRTGSVALSQREAALDRDVVIAVEAEGLELPTAWIETNEEGGQAIAVGFVPALSATPEPADVVFVVDRSGSMGGQAIAETRDALQLCLRSLTPGCLFNIIGFGSTHVSLFPHSRPYDNKSLGKAAAWVQSLEANLGGTELLDPLRQALSGAGTSGRPRQVVVLTDGGVTNTDAVLALAREFRDVSRIFTFGIGAAASQHLVKGLARAGGGAAEFIHPGERIEPKVLRQFARLLSPALYRVRVDWGAAGLRQVPGAVPPVFHGSRLLVYAFADAGLTAPATVRLTAEMASGPMTLTVPVDPGGAVTGRTVATLAARTRIRELEESPEWTTARGSRQEGRKASAATSEIIALAKRFGLMSRETSYVAVERRETPELGDVQLRRIPIALASGWGGLRDELRGHSLVSGLPSGAAAPQAAGAPGFLGFFGAARRADPTTPGSFDANDADDDFEESDDEDMSDDTGEWGDRPLVDYLRAAPGAARWGRSRVSPDRPGGAGQDQQLQHLIALQHADGTWELDRRLAAAIARPFSQLEAALSAAERANPLSRQAWATALALAWLRRHMAAREIEWQLLARKAERHLEARHASDQAAWRQRAEAVLADPRLA